jgi:hypothetical protein
MKRQNERGGVMATEQQSIPNEHINTADVEEAERRAAAARGRAAHAGLLAADSLDRSARFQERVARVEQQTVAQNVSHRDVHERSVRSHFEAAKADRTMAENKRKESEADLAPEGWL